MIGRSNDDHVAGELVELHQEKGDDSFDLAGFVDVPALLAEGIELVEEQHARCGARVLEKASEPGISLAKIGSHKCVVTHCQQWDGNRLGDRLRQ